MKDSPNSFYIREVDETKVCEILKKLSNSKAKDMFNLDTAFIKQHSSSIIKPLTHLINLSISSGKFPDQWKKSVVIPIFKSGDPVEHATIAQSLFSLHCQRFWKRS